MLARFTGRVGDDRGFWYEWGTCAGNNGDPALSALLADWSLAEYLNDDVLAKIAAEGRKGRSLVVGSTNLDAGRSVVWDITRMAASEAPNAPALIHDVILASASIPGVFPPVLIEVEADGRRYDELHVGGGVTAQLFFSPDMPIMSRSIDTLISTQSIGNLAELYIVAREQGLGYQLAYIPQRRGRRTPGPTSPTWRRC